MTSELVLAAAVERGTGIDRDAPALLGETS